jgi:DedD protein
MADESFREIQLSGKQLIALFMTAAVVLIATFLAGVQVGRGVRSQREPAAATDAAQPGGAAVDPTATPAATKVPPPSEPLVQATPPAVPPPQPEEAPPADTRAQAKPAPAPASAIAPAKPAPSAADPGAKAASSDVPAAAAGTEPAGGGYFLKVVAYREKGQADRMAARLTAKGYSTYITPVAGKGTTLYSVRVGKYPTRKEADAVRQRLEQEEQLKPSIAR